jgi:hypothetical protein
VPLKNTAGRPLKNTAGGQAGCIKTMPLKNTAGRPLKNTAGRQAGDLKKNRSVSNYKDIYFIGGKMDKKAIG